MKHNNTTWTCNKVAATLDASLFRSFVYRLIPGFRIRNFIPKDQAEAIANNVSQFVQEYKTAPGVGKAGETLVEHPFDFDEYAELGHIWLSSGISLPEREYLINLVCGYMAVHTGYSIRILRKGDKECFYGIFRKIDSGAGPHIDDVTKDSTAFESKRSVFQGSAILHLQVPSSGGETIIWDRTPQEGDESYLIDNWQYSEALFEGHRYVEVPCIAGELVILSTHNYHKVNPSIEKGISRISFSIFFVIFEDEPGILYIYN